MAPSPGALESARSDALLVPAPSQEGLLATVATTVRALTQAHGVRGDAPGAGCHADLQVISPMRKGPAGTQALNPLLQALLNPPGAAPRF